MKRLYSIISIFLAIEIAAQAQDESVFHRIHGVNVKEYIYLKWDQTENEGKGMFRYSTGKVGDWHDVDEDLIFNVRNEHKNNFKILLEFYNPLQLSIKSTIKDLDDPAYQAISQYFAGLPVSSAVNAPTLPQNAPATYLLYDGQSSAEIDKTILLHEWVYHFSRNIDKSIIATQSKVGPFNELVGSINNVKEVDDYLFNKFIAYNIPDLANEEYTLQGWVKKRSDILYALDNNYNKFNEELQLSNQVKNALIEKKKNADEALTQLINLLTINYDTRIAPFILTTNQEDFKRYSASTAFWLSLNSKQRLEENEKALEMYTNFLSNLTKHIEQYKIVACDANDKNCNNYKEDHDLKLSWKTQKMKQFQYEYNKLNQNGSVITESNQSGGFTVGKKHILFPFVSTGILYTTFSYPNYALTTINGTNAVSEVEETKVNLRPALFLNFLIANWAPVYPFLQLGVTTGVNDAIIPIGLGLSLGQSFSLSGGIMLGYVKDLDKLNVGSEIRDQAALLNDLTNKPVTASYFSINYNIKSK